MAQHTVTLRFAEADWINSFDFARLTAAQRLGIEHLASCNDFTVPRSHRNVEGVVTVRLVPSASLIALVPDLARFAAPDTAGVAA